MRRSDWSRAPDTELCETSGTINEDGIGGVPAFGDTGGTRFTEIGTVPLPPGGPSKVRLEPLTNADVCVATRMVASLDPSGRSVGSAVTVRSIPPGGSVPDAGFTVSHGLSTLAVKVCVLAPPG